MLWATFILLFIVTRATEYLYTKRILQYDSPLVFSFIRAVFGLFFVMIFLFFVDLTIEPLSLFLIFTISLLATAGIYYRTKSFQKFEISYVAPMMNLTPVFVFVFALIFLNEMLTPLKIAGILLITLGLYTLNLSRKDSLLSPFVDFVRHKKFLVLIPILLFSVTPVLDKYTLFSVNPITFIFYLSIFFAINFLILILITNKLRDTKKALLANHKHYFVIGALLLASQVGQYYATALKEISLVNPLLMSSALVIILVSGRIYSEKSILRKFISSAILIAGIAVILI